MNIQPMNPTLKRLINEQKLLARSPLEYIDYYVDEKDLFTWYFLVKGLEKSDYDGGFYMGKIMVSSGFPQTPVDFMMLTPSGRFEIDKKICLTNSGYHAEQWSAVWNMSTILMGFLSIMADDSKQAQGLSHIVLSSDVRRQMAKDSFAFNMSRYKNILVKFTRFVHEDEKGNVRMRSNDEIKAITESMKVKKVVKSTAAKSEPVTSKPEPVAPKTDSLTNELNTNLKLADEPKAEKTVEKVEEPKVEKKPRKRTVKKKDDTDTGIKAKLPKSTKPKTTRTKKVTE